MSDTRTNGAQPNIDLHSEPSASASGDESPHTEDRSAGASPSGGATHTDDQPTGASPGGDGKPHSEDQSHDSYGKEIAKPSKVGERDQSGAEIKNIYSSTRQFVIYEAGDQIRCLLPDDFGVAKGLRQRIADLGGLRASIEDWRCDPSLSPNEKMRAARELAWALAQALEDENKPQSNEPKDILTRVDARLRSLVKSHYRKKYCVANLLAFGVIEVILIVVTVFAFLSGISGNLGAIHRYALYGCFGGLGAFLSVITGLRSIDIDINLSRWEHVFSGATRIMIGVVGGLVIGLALDSRLIDPTFGNSPTSAGSSASVEPRLALSLILAFIAGFSESLVPNLLHRAEQAVGSSEKQNTAPDAPIVKDMKP
jgi:hypothetical protein